MTFPKPRLRGRRGRRLLSAALTLLYFWAFVALGLTHTHAAAHGATLRGLARVALAASADGSVIRPAVALADDAPCAVCAAAHAAPVALAQPPAASHLPVAMRGLAVRPAPLIPTRTSSTLHLRGPPAA